VHSEAEIGELSGPHQTGLYSEILIQNKKKEKMFLEDWANKTIHTKEYKIKNLFTQLWKFEIYRGNIAFQSGGKDELAQ
jgi:hypothetical protein